MHANDVDQIAKTLGAAGTRRGVLGLFTALPVVGAVMAWLDGETPDAEAAGRRRRRKKKHHHQQGKDKRNRKGKQKGKDKGKGKCTKAGQPPKKGNPCCEGLVEDAAGQCAQPAGPTCAETCAGCCDGETCQAGTESGACGTGGAACATCSGVKGLCFNSACACDVCASGCPFSTIPDAIAAASAGDTITICAGTYVGTYTLTKNLTLLGAGDGDDPSVDTILDGNNASTVISVNPGQTVNLSSLRITRGRRLEAGGVRNRGVLTMSDCTVADNESTNNGSGGGISNEETLTMTDCVVSQNRHTGSGIAAAGIRNVKTLKMTGCTVAHNTNSVNGGGGGIRHEGFSPTALTSLTNCVVGPDNTAGVGGGIYAILEGTVELIGTTVQGNHAGSSGGGIRVDDPITLRLSNNSRVRDNSSDGDGGGIWNRRGTVELNASFVGPNNTAAGNGGGIVNAFHPSATSEVKLSGNSKVEANHADGQGGGIFNQETVTGCGSGGTVTDNTAGDPAVASNCIDDGMSASGCTTC